MLKSIETKLIIYLALLIGATIAGTYCAINGHYPYMVLSILFVLSFICKLIRHYTKLNKNLIFLLNAVENGDYSFNFAEDRGSKREQELHKMMNHIKNILARTKKEIVENERFLGLIIESVSTGIIILDGDNHIQTTNRAAHEILGLPVFTHLNQLATLDESFPELFRELDIDDKKQIKLNNEREEVQVSLRASKIKMKSSQIKIITLNNIGSELEAKEMESWVKLIRVMTHEIMNSIAPITSLTDTLLYAYKAAPDDEELRKNTIEALDTISTTAKGLATFVQSYREFTGVPKPQKQIFDLIPLLNKLVHLESANLGGRSITISLQSAPTILVDADQTQISQILINLIKNAIEAIPENKAGEIILEVTRHEKQTVIYVRNNGEPIPAEVLPHIFIPFFTTKDTGTGIGLSVSRYIMRLHGGNLQHHAKDGWTEFLMEF